jgi:hypothetical protein
MKVHGSLENVVSVLQFLLGLRSWAISPDVDSQISNKGNISRIFIDIFKPCNIIDTVILWIEVFHLAQEVFTLVTLPLDYTVHGKVEDIYIVSFICAYIYAFTKWKIYFIALPDIKTMTIVISHLFEMD